MEAPTRGNLIQGYTKYLLAGILLVGIFFLLFISSIPLLGQTKIDECSKNLPIEEKISTATKYIQTYSEILDTNYCLFNSGTGIGPTDWSYTISFKIAPQDIEKWINSYDIEIELESKSITNSTNFYNDPNYKNQRNLFKDFINSKPWKGEGSTIIYEQRKSETGFSIIIFENGIIYINYYGF